MVLLALFVATPSAYAGTKKLPADAVKRLDKAGFSHLKRVSTESRGVVASADLGILVVDGKRNGKRHIIAVQYPGTSPPLVLQEAPATKGARKVGVGVVMDTLFRIKGFVNVGVTTTSKGKAGWRRTVSSHHILRVTEVLAVAARYAGNRNTNPGPRCGSGGYDRVTVRLVQKTPAIIIEVAEQGGGTHSRKIGKRCVQSSPVRSQAKSRRITIKP